MTAQTEATSPAPATRPAAESTTLSFSLEGIVAGLIGAATIAVWFFILDSIQGRPFHTPSVLGAAFFRPDAGLAAAGIVAPNPEMVLVYTFVHGLVFCGIGGVASRLLAAAERNPNLGFGIVVLAVIFLCGFLVVVTLFAETVLQEVAWTSILVGNVLAAAAMAAYFWRRHRGLTILP